MSCEAGANRVARWASQVGVGISHLANKRAFYAGVGLGGAGLLGAGLIALAVRLSLRPELRPRGAHDEARRRNKKRQQNKESQEKVMMQPIPQLDTRTKIGPTRYLSAATRCAGCQTPRTSKQGTWYSIKGRSYCQDCAPAAARQAGVDLARDTREQRSKGAGEMSFTPTPPPPRSPALDYLPPERRVETRLARSRLRLNVGREPHGKPAWFVVEQGYVLLRPNGSDTGLAITPALRIGSVRDGLQAVEEDTGRWWLTHIPSGKTLSSQPYASLEEAQLLGNVLAQVDWTRPETEIADDEISQVAETIRHYNQALAEEKGKIRAAPVFGVSTPPTVGSTRRPGANEELTGKLMADGYGGVARVLDVSPDGETLFMIDSLGQRYEVSRNQIRTPDASDFEMCRVAMSFDPAKIEGALPCARCGQAPPGANGEKWYRMGWQVFCPACATVYAAEEGYIKDEEIDSNLGSI